ncbi:hypothetical protein [Streptomyces sp. NPDC087297]|uniref:hypothetical protein n=1 Tax=Streptomyces sp. NPDC087297 TaxID=3365778 RepID=UPI00381C84D2
MGPSLAARNEPSGDRRGVIRSAATDNTVVPLRPTLAGDGSTTDHQVAAWWESMFLKMGRTLTDEPTAEAHRITAAAFGLLIDGARASGVIDDSQASYLAGMAVEAIRAPDFVPRTT